MQVLFKYPMMVQQHVNYNSNSVLGVAKKSLNIITEQLKSNVYYTTVTTVNGIHITKEYGDSDIPVGISGEVGGSDLYLRNLDLTLALKFSQLLKMKRKVVKVFKRFRLTNASVFRMVLLLLIKQSRRLLMLL